MTGGRQDASGAGSCVTNFPFGDCGHTVAAASQDFHVAITEAAQWRCGPPPQEAVAAAPQDSRASTGSSNSHSCVASTQPPGGNDNTEHMLQRILLILEGFGDRLSRIEEAVLMR